MAVDAMFKLEHGVEDIDKNKEAKDRIEGLEDFQESRWKDDYAANSLLRQKMRAKRKSLKVQEEKDRALNLNIPLLPPSEEDTKQSALLQFSLVSFRIILFRH